MPRFRAFSGEVETGSPQENATKKNLQQFSIQLDRKRCSRAGLERQMPVVQLEATSRFYPPAYSGEWSDPQLPARIEAMLSLLFKGLEAPHKR